LSIRPTGVDKKDTLSISYPVHLLYNKLFPAGELFFPPREMNAYFIWR
jgi:hypothetical protein